MSFTFFQHVDIHFPSLASQTLVSDHIFHGQACAMNSLHLPTFDLNGPRSGVPFCVEHIFRNAALSRRSKHTAWTFASGFLCWLNSETARIVFPLVNNGFLAGIRCTSVKVLLLSLSSEGWIPPQRAKEASPRDALMQETVCIKIQRQAPFRLMLTRLRSVTRRRLYFWASRFALLVLPCLWWRPTGWSTQCFRYGQVFSVL